MVRDMASAEKARNAPSKRLLGKVLVDGEIILREDLEAALAEQNRTNEMLGEILVRMGVVDPAEIAAAVSIQSDLASLEDAVKAAAGVRLLLGELLLKAGKITREQLNEALAEQRRSGERLGEVLVRKGLLSENELDVALAFQQYQGGEAPGSVKLRLGEILVTTGQITREQLDAVLGHQKISGKKIGELLLESGIVEPRQVESGLKLQERLVAAALIAAFSFASVAHSQEIRSARPPVPPSGVTVSVSAVVPSRASLKVVYQRPEIVVTGDDIARGYVDMPSASRIEVVNNNREGCLLSFVGRENAYRLIEQVRVEGLGGGVLINPGGGLVPLPYSKGKTMMVLSYRFLLSAEARPGAYPWPFEIAIRPF